MAAQLLHFLQVVRKDMGILMQLTRGEIPHMKDSAAAHWETAHMKLGWSRGSDGDPDHLMGAGDAFVSAYNFYVRSVRKNLIAKVLGAGDQADSYKRACESALMAAVCYQMRGGKGGDVRANVANARFAFQRYYDAEVQAEHLRYNSIVSADGAIAPVTCPTPKTKRRLEDERRELELAIGRT
ncbi:hypothetical protein ACFWFU_05370 [Streptomyces sp. NPDC060235]|uniref:hypothetical protein n=1 Tax=Streptomyces sp. NPDC060235 TaxID=3347080 RepID=UPI003659DFBA